MDSESHTEDEKPLDESRLATQVDLWSYESYADDEAVESQPNFVSLPPSKIIVETIMIALNDETKAVRSSHILVLGVRSKSDVPDAQDSPVLGMIERLLHLGALVSYHDPSVARLTVGNGQTLESVELSAALLRSLDCLVILTNDRVFDTQRIADQTRLVIDCCNALANVTGNARVVTP